MSILFPRPRNFPYRLVFYSDSYIAMMYGTYKDSSNESLGLRWTEAESDLGYPNTRGQGMWMVVPDKLALYMLEGIANNPREAENIRDRDEFNRALKDLRSRLAEGAPG